MQQALEWCHNNNVEVQFYPSHVELSYGSGFYTSSEVEFIDAVIDLKRKVEGK